KRALHIQRPAGRRVLHCRTDRSRAGRMAGCRVPRTGRDSGDQNPSRGRREEDSGPPDSISCVANMTHLDASPRWLALYVLCAGVLMIVLDTTIVNVALPSIRQ